MESYQTSCQILNQVLGVWAEVSQDVSCCLFPLAWTRCYPWDVALTQTRLCQVTDTMRTLDVSLEALIAWRIRSVSASSWLLWRCCIGKKCRNDVQKFTPTKISGGISPGYMSERNTDQKTFGIFTVILVKALLTVINVTHKPCNFKHWAASLLKTNKIKSTAMVIDSIWVC